MMRLLNIIVLLGVVLISSCSVNVNEVVKGWWSIDTIYYKNYNIRTCLVGNALEFKADGEIMLPVAEKYCEPVVTKSFDKLGTWEILKSGIQKDTIPLRMKISTANEVFVGTHKIVFYKDISNKLLKMEIWSDSLYIMCRKGLYDFDENLKTINELEKMSWTNRP